MKLKFNFNKRNRYNNNCNVIDYTITEAIYKYRTNTGKMTASDYTHLFGYLNPYYRSAYNIPKCRK